MAKEDDILREQRRRQQELIELKKLRQSGGSIPNEAPPAAPDTPRSRLSHFWFYNKYYVIVGAILTVVVAILVAQCVNKPKYDYTILLNASEMIYDVQDEVIEKTFRELGSDLNGDGEVTVLVVNCSRDESGIDKQYVTAQRTKFETQVYESVARILFISDDLFDIYNTDQVMLWSDHFALPEKEGKALSVNDTTLAPVFEGCRRSYYIGYRVSDTFDTPDAALFEQFLAACRTDQP